MTLPRLLYTTALRIGSPAAMLYLERRSRRQAGTADNWRARCGFGARDRRAPVWLHGASVGEIQSLAPLAAALARSYPIRMSAFTATGRARARALLPQLPVDLAPLDLPGAWRRYLDRTAPRIAVIAETELWPNLLATTAERKIPVWLVSARMGEKTARRLRRFPATARALMRGLHGVLAQSESDLERFVELGLPRQRARVTGSLKQALIIPETVRDRGGALRTRILPRRPVWVAGSVRVGEEAAIAEAAERVHAALPSATTVVVPRHPETAPGFIGALKGRGLQVMGGEALDSTIPLPSSVAIVVDRVGVLLELYAAADAAFVGGTLVPVGGHNVLEPALLGLPVLIGPHQDNVLAAVKRLKNAGALAIVRDGAELGKEVAALLTDATVARAMGLAGREAASDDAALQSTIECLLAAL